MKLAWFGGINLNLSFISIQQIDWKKIKLKKKAAKQPISLSGLALIDGWLRLIHLLVAALPCTKTSSAQANWINQASLNQSSLLLRCFQSINHSNFNFHQSFHYWSIVTSHYCYNILQFNQTSFQLKLIEWMKIEWSPVNGVQLK